MYFLREKRNNENELIANFEEINKKQIENKERKHMIGQFPGYPKKYKMYKKPFDFGLSELLMYLTTRVKQNGSNLDNMIISKNCKFYIVVISIQINLIQIKKSRYFTLSMHSIPINSLSLGFLEKKEISKLVQYVSQIIISNWNLDENVINCPFYDSNRKERTLNDSQMFNFKSLNFQHSLFKTLILVLIRNVRINLNTNIYKITRSLIKLLVTNQLSIYIINKSSNVFKPQSCFAIKFAQIKEINLSKYNFLKNRLTLKVINDYLIQSSIYYNLLINYMNTHYEGFFTQKLSLDFDEFVYKITRNQQMLVFLLMTFFALFRIVSTLIAGKSFYILYGGGFLIYTIILLVISYKGKLWVKKYGNLLTCCVLSLLQIQEFQINNLEELQQNSQLIVIFLMIIYSFLNLKGACFQLIVFIGLKTWIQISEKGNFSILNFIFYLLEAISIGLFVYFQQQGLNIRFSQECFQKQLFRFLPDLVQNQFMMFNLEQQSSSFHLRFQSEITSIKWDDSNAPTSNLRAFLRNTYYQDQSLEQYILSRNDLNSNNYNHYYAQNLIVYNVDNDQSSIDINYVECFLGQKYYLITFNENKYDCLERINNSLITCINRNQQLTISFLKKQLNQISTIMTTKSQIQLLAKLKIHCMYFLGQFLQVNSFSQIDRNIKDINLTKLLQLMVNLYCNAYQPIQIELQSDEYYDFYIQSNEELIQTFFQILCQLLIRLKANQTRNQLIFGQDQSTTKLFYIVVRTECYQEYKIQLQNNPFFQKIQRRLCPNLDILAQNQCKIYSSYIAVKLYLYKNYQPLEEMREFEDEII